MAGATVDRHINSLFSSCAYRVGGCLLDPGDEWEGFADVEAILLTHAHFDHIYGVDRVLELNPGAMVYTNEIGREMLLSDKLNLSRYHETPYVCRYPERIRLVEDGEILRFGEVEAEALFTPGHSGSCVTWLIGDALFSGDSWIPGVKTVVNLPGADKALAKASEERIRSLAAGHRLFPGHFVG